MRNGIRIVAFSLLVAMLFGMAGLGGFALAAENTCCAKMSRQNRGVAASSKAPIASFTVLGQQHSTTEFRGHRTMLFLLSTWCGSCAAGLQAMAQHMPQLNKDGLQVVILRNYRNGGYPGPDIRQFVAKVAPAILKDGSWTLGDATPALEQAYNGHGYPDIYFLIDTNGTIQAVNSAPSASMDSILAFAEREHEAAR